MNPGGPAGRVGTFTAAGVCAEASKSSRKGDSTSNRGAGVAGVERSRAAAEAAASRISAARFSAARCRSSDFSDCSDSDGGLRLGG